MFQEEIFSFQYGKGAKYSSIECPNCRRKVLYNQYELIIISKMTCKFQYFEHLDKYIEQVDQEFVESYFNCWACQGKIVVEKGDETVGE